MEYKPGTDDDNLTADFRNLLKNIGGFDE